MITPKAPETPAMSDWTTTTTALTSDRPARIRATRTLRRITTVNSSTNRVRLVTVKGKVTREIFSSKSWFELWWLRLILLYAPTKHRHSRAK